MFAPVLILRGCVRGLPGLVIMLMIMMTGLMIINMPVTGVLCSLLLPVPGTDGVRVSCLGDLARVLLTCLGNENDVCVFRTVLLPVFPIAGRTVVGSVSLPRGMDGSVLTCLGSGIDAGVFLGLVAVLLSPMPWTVIGFGFLA